MINDLKIIVAPMAGVTDLAFRRILRENGATLCYSEMVNVMALAYGSEKTMTYLKTNENDKPFGIQLFGNDKEYFKKAVKIIEKSCDYEYLDINMGCPMRKIISNGSGAALLKDEDKAIGIVDAVKSVSTKPVSVKIRLGIDDDSINSLSMAKKISELGVHHISIHARTVKDMYSGKARWDYIKEVKENVSIPVVGNGDIFTLDDARKAFDEYGVDGIMLARGIQGNPFLLNEIKNYIDGKEEINNVTKEHLINTMNKHLNYMIENTNEKIALVHFRKHLVWYLKKFGINSKIRKEFTGICTKQDFDLLCKDLLLHSCSNI